MHINTGPFRTQKTTLSSNKTSFSYLLITSTSTEACPKKISWNGPEVMLRTRNSSDWMMHSQAWLHHWLEAFKAWFGAFGAVAPASARDWWDLRSTCEALAKCWQVEKAPVARKSQTERETERWLTRFDYRFSYLSAFSATKAWMMPPNWATTYARPSMRPRAWGKAR